MAEQAGIGLGAGTRGAGTRGVVRRRGLLAGAAALVAGGLARLASSSPARAEHAADDTLMHFAGDSTNTPAARAYVQLQNVGETQFVIGVDGFAASSTVHAYGFRGGISNFGGSRGAGIFGSAAAASGNQAAGVYGFADTVALNVHPNRASAVGVHGLSNARLGVRGDSRQSVGVLGVAGTGAETVAAPAGQIGVAGSASSGIGVYGSSASSFGVFGGSNTAVGVFGFAAGAAGVYGNSTNSVGVFGQASQSAGVYGVSPVYGVWGQATTGWGVYGEGTGNGGIGVVGKAGPNGGYAGYFNGNVYVTGQLFINGVPVSAPDAARTDARQAAPKPARVREVMPPVAPVPPATSPDGAGRER